MEIETFLRDDVEHFNGFRFKSPFFKPVTFKRERVRERMTFGAHWILAIILVCHFHIKGLWLNLIKISKDDFSGHFPGNKN